VCAIAIVLNRLLIGQFIAEIWSFLIFRLFQDGGPSAVRDFKKLEILTAVTDEYASPCQISCRSDDALPRYDHLLFLKMAAIRHIGFAIGILRPSTRYLVVSITVQNLVGIDGAVSTTWRFLIILHVWLENAYLRPKIGGLWHPKC